MSQYHTEQTLELLRTLVSELRGLRRDVNRLRKDDPGAHTDTCKAKGCKCIPKGQ